MRLFFRYLSHLPAKCWQLPLTSPRCIYLICPILQRQQDQIQVTLTDASPQWVAAALRQWEMKLQLRSGVYSAEYPCCRVCSQISILLRRHISSWAIPNLKNPYFLTAFPKPPDRVKGLSAGLATTASLLSVLDVTGGGKNLSLQKARMESAIASATAGRGTLARHEVALDWGRKLGLTIEPHLLNQFDQNWASDVRSTPRVFHSSQVKKQPGASGISSKTQRSIWK